MHSSLSLALRVAAAPAVAAAVLIGVWLTGGVVTDDFAGSALLTGLWFAAAGVACLAVAMRHRSYRAPVLGAYVATAAGVTVWLGWSTLRDRVVDERVATGPAIAAGAFRSGEHTTTGRAAVVRLPTGRRVLTLTAFQTDAGPDLRVRLVPGDTGDGGASGNIDLGPLKGNRGNQQYAVPAGAAVDGHSVVIWCRAFSASFGSAVLRRS
jgi:hypothetical protein